MTWLRAVCWLKGHDWSEFSMLPSDHYCWCGRCGTQADYRDVLGGTCLCCGEEGPSTRSVAEAPVERGVNK